MQQWILAAPCACAALGGQPHHSSWPSARPEVRQAAARTRRQRLAVHASIATGPPSGGGGDNSDDLLASFRQELEKRDIASAAAAEAEHAVEFDGSALLQVIQDRSVQTLPVTEIPAIWRHSNMNASWCSMHRAQV